MEYQWISLSGRVWAPRCPVHPLWWSSHPGSTEWQPAMWAKTHRWWKQPVSWVTAHIFKGISEPHTFALTWVPSLALGSLNLSSLPPIVFFSFFFFFVCVCVCVRFGNLPFLFQGPCIFLCVSVALLPLGSPAKKSELSSRPPLSLTARLSLLRALHHAGLFCQ